MQSATSVVELHDNPSLAIRIVKEALKVALCDESFRHELVTSLRESIPEAQLEPLYSTKLAARLVPCSLAHFRVLIHKVPDLSPPYYRLVGKSRSRNRLYYASDIKKIRAYLSAPYRKDTKVKFRNAAYRGIATGERGNKAAKRAVL